MSLRLLILLGFLTILGCQRRALPTERYYQFKFSKDHVYEDGELRIQLKNPVLSPVRIWLKSEQNSIRKILEQLSPITLLEQGDTTLVFSDLSEFEDDITYRIALGSLEKEIVPSLIELPFTKGNRYRIIQGNNTDFTHNNDFSHYAIDFSLEVNDTITSASDGVVVGVIEDYEFGGEGPEWRPYGNFITIYQSSSGRYFQYVHLVYQGSLVQVGDSIASGQPIALSGETGQTNIPHLHFNCLIPVDRDGDVKSYPVTFREGYEGQKLKKGDWVEK